jgi:uncharacterized SAM-binding protein YcdF (DUF218 family)
MTIRLVQRASRQRGIIGFVLILLILIGWCMARAGSALVVRVQIASPDAIVSLASHEWERLPLAARLARAHPAALLLLTVPQPPTPFNCHDCANRVNHLAALGIDQSRIRMLQLTTPGTYGEALALRAFAEREGIRSLVLATSPYHTRRALAVFRAIFRGTDVRIGVEPASDTSPARPTGWWWAVGYDRAYVAYEWAAVVYYAWHYRVGFSKQE